MAVMHRPHFQHQPRKRFGQNFLQDSSVIDRITANHHRTEQVHLLRDLCDTMLHGSLCAMGGMTPNPVLSALNHYPADFGMPAPDPQAA